jgi:eukaryotic-like serine/threonine-protein kinase
VSDLTNSPARGCQRTARFGVFEIDLTGTSMRRNGSPVKVPQQSMLLLTYLIERHGSVVSREELCSLLWPEGTFVEFDLGLNAAMNRLRRSLGDFALEPRYIETIPKKGYRFIAPVNYPREEKEPLPSSPLQLENIQTSFGAGISTLPPSLPDAPVVPPVVPEVGAPARGIVRQTLLMLAGSLALVLCGMALGFWFVRSHRDTASPDQVYRYALPLDGTDDIGSMAISPPGDQIVFQGASGLLWRRYLERNDPRPIPGTEGGTAPFFSPDGQSVGFFAGNNLKIAESGRIRSLTALPPDFSSFVATWGEDGFVYFNTRIGPVQGIWRIPAHGGKSELVTPSLYPGTGPMHPLVNQVLLHPRHLLIYSMIMGPIRRSLRVRDLDTQTDKLLTPRGTGGYLLPNGKLIYFNRGSLYAAGFNAEKLELQGTPVEMIKNVADYGWQAGFASISQNGTLAYVERGGPDLRLLQWVDGNGHVTPLDLPADQYEEAEVSPRGDQLAIVRTEGVGRASLWTYAFRNRAWRHILDSDVPRLRAQWSPDEKALAVSSARQNEDFANLYRVPLSNPDNMERLTQQPDYGQFPLSWSAQSNAILYVEGVHETTRSDVLLLPLDGLRVPKLLIATPGWDRSASFSPDGRWLVYEIEFQGAPGIFVRRFNAQKLEFIGPPMKISVEGGSDPNWAPDGRSIYYSDLSKHLTQASLSSDGSVVSRRKAEVSLPAKKDSWTRINSVAPDGRLLIMRPVTSPAKQAEIRLVIHWDAEVDRLAPAS